MEDIGINELIINQHPRLQPPPTRFPVTKTIDELFGTPELDVVQGGYAPFLGYSDLRLAWIDTNWEIALGFFQKIQQPFSVVCNLTTHGQLKNTSHFYTPFWMMQI